jgi:hypothetical protein
VYITGYVAKSKRPRPETPRRSSEAEEKEDSEDSPVGVLQNIDLTRGFTKQSEQNSPEKHQVGWSHINYQILKLLKF